MSRLVMATAGHSLGMSGISSSRARVGVAVSRFQFPIEETRPIPFK